jgi:Tol biopolymer transport system component/DNA-binding winged helix-turn-helix (wHTH) protein
MRNFGRIHGAAMSQQIKHIYEFGPFRLDATEQLLLRGGEAVPLTPKAFDLLLRLVEHEGHLLTKDELLRLVWPDTFVEEATLASNISQLRKALGEGDNGHRYIETVPKRGYRFVAEVNGVAEEEAPQVSPPEKGSGVMSEFAGLRRYRRGAVFALALMVVVGTAFGLYQLIRWRHSRARIAVPALQVIPLTSFPGWEGSPSFSPDGSQIAYARGGEVYVKQIDGQGFLRLTNNPANDATPAWSPDGRYIAFMRYAPEGNGVYLAPAIGGPERKLASVFPGLEFWRRPAWSPDGELLAVVDRNAEQDPLSLYLLLVETGERRRLTHPPHALVDHHSPAFSPDGKTIALTQRVRRTESVLLNLAVEQSIYLIPAAGGDPSRLNLESSGGEILNTATYPTWTPDGKELVFSSRLVAHLPSKLWRVSASGGVAEEIPVGTNVSEIAISAQRNRLAFVQTDYDLDVWRVDLSDPAPGDKPLKKFITSTRLDVNAEFSPDGRKIAFASDRSGEWALWVCDSDGSNPRQLTSDIDQAASPRWSPDGQQIVFDGIFGGSQDVCVIGAEGGQWRRLTTEPASDSMPCWSRDGQWIYFNSNRGGKEQIWKLPSAGGEAVQVTRQGGYLPIASPDGKFIYYGKRRDGPGIWRIPVGGGKESFVLDEHGAGYGKHWTVTDDGIYFLTTEDPAKPVLEFFSFKTGKVSRVAALERIVSLAFRGLSVSPDKRWLLSTQIERYGGDIMLVENFR